MKITNSQLKEIIKEEAKRLYKKTILENKKKAIVKELKMLNENEGGTNCIKVLSLDNVNYSTNYNGEELDSHIYAQAVEMAEEKYSNGTKIEFIYVDEAGKSHKGELTLKGEGDYDTSGMFDDDSKTSDLGDHVIDLFDDHRTDAAFIKDIEFEDDKEVDEPINEIAGGELKPDEKKRVIDAVLDSSDDYTREELEKLSLKDLLNTFKDTTKLNEKEELDMSDIDMSIKDKAVFSVMDSEEVEDDLSDIIAKYAKQGDDYEGGYKDDVSVSPGYLNESNKAYIQRIVKRVLSEDFGGPTWIRERDMLMGNLMKLIKDILIRDYYTPEELETKISEQMKIYGQQYWQNYPKY